VSEREREEERERERERETTRDGKIEEKRERQNIEREKSERRVEQEQQSIPTFLLNNHSIKFSFMTKKCFSLPQPLLVIVISV